MFQSSSSEMLLKTIERLLKATIEQQLRRRRST
jgi:hypothetical protein